MSFLKNSSTPFVALALAAYSLAACTSTNTITSSPVVQQTKPALQLYEVQKDTDGSKMLRGIIQKELITNDTSFAWYQLNANLTKPNANAVAAVAAKASAINIVIFGGTWCEDTQQLLPKYLNLLNAANFANERLTIVAVDRAKTTVANLHKTFNVTNVPTCIVLKDGKEIGRIVEFGKTALVDKELGEMVAAIQ
jgi:thiol-disulfide isomerase/thioredoxin